jgi:thiosulfate reductase cytochrome b subunit
MKASPVYRHRLPTRLAHWVTVLCAPILVLSGFQIFNAHPALYWGERSDGQRAVLAMRAERTPGGTLKGITHVFGRDFDTTGVLGASRDGALGIQDRGFPNWATLPGHQWLAMGRRWHFFFAWAFVLNGLAFAGYAVLGGHLSRDLMPSGPELRAIGRALRDHLLFRFRHGDAADRYNVLQKLAYASIIFVAAPLLVLTGLAMSPRVDAAIPALPAVFGGRQSARTLHFLLTLGLIAFTAVHLFMVLVTGFWNNVRSMILGWYRLPSGGPDDDSRAT